MSECIRFVEISDIPKILEIYRPYIEETAITFEYEVPTMTEFRARVQQIAQTYPYLVYEIDGEVVGYAYASQQRERAAYQWNVELSVYVSQTQTSRGIGRKLCEAIFKLLVKQNICNVYSIVTSPNEKSEKLHTALGFQKIGIFHQTGYKFSQWYDVIWFEKKLCSQNGEPHKFIPITEIT